MALPRAISYQPSAVSRWWPQHSRGRRKCCGAIRMGPVDPRYPEKAEGAPGAGECTRFIKTVKRSGRFENPCASASVVVGGGETVIDMGEPSLWSAKLSGDGALARHLSWWFHFFAVLDVNLLGDGLKVFFLPGLHDLLCGTILAWATREAWLWPGMFAPNQRGCRM